MPHIPDHPLELDRIPGHTSYSSGVTGGVYNEAGFRHFLQIELRRAARVGPGLLLVLVDSHNAAGHQVALTPSVAGRVFGALGACVREVDFVGWFRDGRVAAAALIQRATPTSEIRQQIARRVMKRMSRERVPWEGKPRVRIVPLRGKR